MSSQLTSLVPVLDGTNYQQWAAAMQSFLMSQGQWKCTKPGAYNPGYKNVTKTDSEGASSTKLEIDEDISGPYEELAEKALGNIRLRLHNTIGYQHNEESDPSALWETLKDKYGVPGMSKAFVEFKGLMETVIPNGSDPSPSLDKIMAHHIRLKEMDYQISDKVLAMMILAKAPSTMESIVQLMSQAAKQSGEELKVPEVIKAMSLSWETHGRQGAGRQNQQRANKLSAVRPAGQPPQFNAQQQQPNEQQRGDGQGWRGGRGGGRRGKRGGKKNAQQQLAQTSAQEQQPPPGPPTLQWAPSPMPQAGPPQYAAGPSNMGYIASPVAYLPTRKPPTPLPIGSGSWTTFNKSLDLAQ